MIDIKTISGSVAALSVFFILSSVFILVFFLHNVLILIGFGY